MRAQGILFHQLECDLASKSAFHASRNIDLSKLLGFEIAIACEFTSFAGQVGAFGVGLRTDGNVFSSSHRHCAGDESSDTCNQCFTLGGSCRRDSKNETCGRNDPVVCPQHGGPQPSNPLDQMTFFMEAAHVRCYSVNRCVLAWATDLRASHAAECPEIM